MVKLGKEYENFVARLQQAILSSEKFGKQKNIVIEKNKIIRDNCGIDREFDLYWEYELGGFTYKTVIECKDYNAPISVLKVDELVGKILDMPELKPVFATKNRYQAGAKKKAKQHGIELLIVREQNDSDWCDEHGNPYITSVNITGHFILPVRITCFQPSFDGKWIKQNRPDIDITKPLQLQGINNEIFVDEVCNNVKYSLYDLADKLTSLEENKPGFYERVVEFTEAYIIHNDDKYKIISYKVMYHIPEPIESNISVDISKELIGVVEYINKGLKLKIFQDGNIHQGKIALKKPKNHLHRKK